METGMDRSSRPKTCTGGRPDRLMTSEPEVGVSKEFRADDDDEKTPAKSRRPKSACWNIHRRPKFTSLDANDLGVDLDLLDLADNESSGKTGQLENGMVPHRSLGNGIRNRCVGEDGKSLVQCCVDTGIGKQSRVNTGKCGRADDKSVQNRGVISSSLHLVNPPPNSVRFSGSPSLSRPSSGTRRQFAISESNSLPANRKSLIDATLNNSISKISPPFARCRIKELDTMYRRTHFQRLSYVPTARFAPIGVSNGKCPLTPPKREDISSKSDGRKTIFDGIGKKSMELRTAYADDVAQLRLTYRTKTEPCINLSANTVGRRFQRKPFQH